MKVMERIAKNELNENWKSKFNVIALGLENVLIHIHYEVRSEISLWKEKNQNKKENTII